MFLYLKKLVYQKSFNLFLLFPVLLFPVLGAPKAKASSDDPKEISLSSSPLYNSIASDETATGAYSFLQSKPSLDQLTENSLSREDSLRGVSSGKTLFEESGLSGPGVPIGARRERTEIIYYEVKDGDTVGSIAIDFEISIDTILSANNLKLSDYIHPGEKLKILPQSGVMHKIKKSETLSSIAEVYQVDLQKIKEANKLESESIKAGDELFIPGATLSAVDEAKNLNRTQPQKKNFKKRNLFSASSFSSSSSSSKQSAFLWPVRSRKINSGFGYRRWGRRAEFHKGVDIDGNRGDPIKAASGGKIVFAGWKRGYGKMIMVQHSNGISTIYAHMSRFKRTQGYVKQGEIIGYVGSTGRSTGSHLHFEVRVQGRAVNPLKYIR